MEALISLILAFFLLFFVLIFSAWVIRKQSLKIKSLENKLGKGKETKNEKAN